MPQLSTHGLTSKFLLEPTVFFYVPTNHHIHIVVYELHSKIIQLRYDISFCQALKFRNIIFFYLIRYLRPEVIVSPTQHSWYDFWIHLGVKFLSQNSHQPPHTTNNVRPSLKYNITSYNFFLLGLKFPDTILYLIKHLIHTPINGLVPQLCTHTLTFKSLHTCVSNNSPKILDITLIKLVNFPFLQISRSHIYPEQISLTFHPILT